MFKKIFSLIIVFLLSLTLVACGSCNKEDDDDQVNDDNNQVDESVSNISIDQSTIPTSISKQELDSILGSIKVIVSKNDSTTETIALSKSMLSSEDQAKLSEVGTHNLKVTYSGKETSLTLTITTNNYLVRVLYPNNSPVTDKVRVQWCTDATCYTPVKVNSQGYAESALNDDLYYIHIERIPDGYTYDPNIYTATADSKYVEIKLVELCTFKNGTGSQDAPYEMETGAYNVLFETEGNAGMKYFSFTATESGTYNLKSLATDKFALNPTDPYLGFLGTSDNLRDMDISGNIKDVVNFDYTFVAEAGVTYKFIIQVSSATKFPTDFNIQITKK